MRHSRARPDSWTAQRWRCEYKMQRGYRAQWYLDTLLLDDHPGLRCRRHRFVALYAYLVDHHYFRRRLIYPKTGETFSEWDLRKLGMFV